MRRVRKAATVSAGRGIARQNDQHVDVVGRRRARIDQLTRQARAGAARVAVLEAQARTRATPLLRGCARAEGVVHARDQLGDADRVVEIAVRGSAVVERGEGQRHTNAADQLAGADTAVAIAVAETGVAEQRRAFRIGRITAAVDLVAIRVAVIVAVDADALTRTRRNAGVGQRARVRG